jgi:hypothetical protein
MKNGKLRDELAMYGDDVEVSFITSQGVEIVTGIESELTGDIALITKSGQSRLWGIAVEVARD